MTIDPGRYVREPMPRRPSWSGMHAEHLDDVPHDEAPVPRWLHRCWPQTIALIGFTQVQRCPCGAIRNGAAGYWSERNSAKRKDRPPVPTVAFSARKQVEVDNMEERFARRRA